jgi:dihydrofolate reductase
MGKLVFGMMQSLDGYVDGVAGALEFPPPGDALARHFNDHVRGLAGCLYGRRIYEIMRYWDEDRPEWDAGDHDFAGPALAASLTDLGLIDEYRLYFRPFVLGGGKPYFARARPPLRILASDRVGEDAVRLTCVPA